MHKNDYRMFDGFYIPVIPDADYHSTPTTGDTISCLSTTVRSGM